MASLLYSQVARISPEELKKLKECEKERKEREKELYSKECVAHSINLVVGEASNEVTDLNVLDRFSCYLATILARDKEVVAVWLRNIEDRRCEIYLSKKFDWLKKDDDYIDNITKNPKEISKNDPTKSKNAGSDLFVNVILYCSAKLKSRWDKLIKNDGNNIHVKLFKEFLKSNSDSDKKVGSYYESIKGIIECARNIKYKSLFSNVKVLKGKPDITNNQPVYSWKYTIRSLIDEDQYNCFMDRCSNEPRVIERINKVYTNNITQQQQLDRDDVIGKWKLPHIKDSDFEDKFLTYLLKKLDQIIVEKLEYYTSSPPASSDSGGVSPDPYVDNCEYMKEFAKKHTHRVEKVDIYI
ncbi:hypothetical protein C1646_771686 [Rhizophagus diaphanus]|nr:hypothetical protein C1646_771686 [Rhizophagus diaphanus] [Rhizophagus sp. MUCL 43196]